MRRTFARITIIDKGAARLSKSIIGRSFAPVHSRPILNGPTSGHSNILTRSSKRRSSSMSIAISVSFDFSSAAAHEERGGRPSGDC